LPSGPLGMLAVGLLLGGLTSGLVLGLAGGLVSPLPLGVRHIAAVALAVTALLRETGLLRLPLPQNSRQIGQEVLRNPLRGALQFGFELGTGVRTYVSATAPYAVAAAVLLAGSLPAALLAGLGFGAGRAVTPLLRQASADQAGWDARLVSRLRLNALLAATATVAALAVLFWVNRR
jgi:hypothetical protein